MFHECEPYVSSYVVDIGIWMTYHHLKFKNVEIIMIIT